MPILPIDSGRYGTPEMLRVFEEENRLQRMLDVEAALAWAHAELGNIPRGDAEVIMRMASTDHVKLSRVKEIEREIRHETMAVVKALVEVCGESGKYVHLGATSSDILDTALALQLKDALNILERRLGELEGVLMELAERYKGVVIVGRTHGQHAVPTTLGFKFAVWMRGVSRHIQRLRECRRRVLVGKMSGAVGTQAGLGPRGMEIQRLVMERLGLEPADISTQIVPRDRHAELVCILAMLASTLENFATEIRQLQRTEIAELSEPFNVKAQIGSSTMPHKRNPIRCERICGLAKIVRSLVIPALENIVTWHERDLTQSSAERFIIPEALILTDYMTHLMIGVLSGLRVDEERMRRNLEITRGGIMSEAVMLALTRKGMGRDEAYMLVRSLAIKSMEEGRHLKDVLMEDPTVRRLLTREEIEEAMKPENYLGTAMKQVEMMIELTESERRARASSL